MAEGSGGFTGSKTDGGDVVHYRNGEEVGRSPINGGSGSGGSGGGSGEGGTGEGGSGGSGDGGRGARISAILSACHSIRDSLSSFFQSAQSSLSTFRENFSRTISQTVSSVKTAAQKLIPQSKKEKSGKILGPAISGEVSQAALELSKQTSALLPISPTAKDAEGDPVIKSSGLNRQTNTDISVEIFGGIYAVTRHHAPCADRGGSSETRGHQVWIPA